ncbi:MAG: 4-hydroxy-tetrahydrodipicolinate reductase [Treponema sp.]|nr:4-hydroxy-tetrahydrodipicolinate reductase [Treponema sp.]
MNIAIIGYGKMGKMVEDTALALGHKIAVIVDPAAKDTPSGIPTAKTIADFDFASIDKTNPVCAVEFTQPDTAVTNIIALAERGIPTVTGTTGWYDRLDEVQQVIEKANGQGLNSALLWASNFSIGVNLFWRMAWYAAELINNFPEYDVGGFESHHNKKIDSPSGTAKTLAEGVLERIKRKNKIVWETMNRKPETDEFHFPSLRLGSVPGQHSLFFDSAADTIEITHTARSREGFASGAVRASEWLTAKKRLGLFTIDDMIKELL